MRRERLLQSLRLPKRYYRVLTIGRVTRVRKELSFPSTCYGLIRLIATPAACLLPRTIPSTEFKTLYIIIVKTSQSRAPSVKRVRFFLSQHFSRKNRNNTSDINKQH